MSNIFSNRRVRQLLALFLAAIILFGLYTDSTGLTLSAEDTSRAYVLLDGEKVDEVTLIEDEKLRLEAASEETASAYGWQIRDPKDSERWINISDGYSRYLWLTHALVGSMLTESGTAYLRCKLQLGTEEVFTEALPVTVSRNVPPPATAPEEALRTVTVASPVLGAGETAGSDQDSGGNLTTYSIVINYLFDDNSMAFEPYGASVAAGSNFSATIESPSIVGYDPYRRDGGQYIEAKTVVFDLKNIRENVTVNVIYEPALVNVTIHHHLQNLNDDEYSVNYDLITHSKAITGTIVGDGLALTEAELPGFHALAYEKLEVAADGSTVIEIRYDRNYYLVDFNMSGGYGTEPIYTRYGASVGANDPIRHGYVFGGWELVGYGGAAPTMEQQSAYALQTGTTILLPPANLSYKARWITQETTYKMVFWCENADDENYSYWGYLDNLPALSGSYVSGQDLISRVAGIEDEQYFTFNASKTDRNVLVEGDGSTVVNVYYTRNYYTITFKAPGKCVIPEKHTHTDACYEDICGQAHVHTEDCNLVLQCPLAEHTAHTSDCIVCGYEEHVHGSVGCDCNKEEHAHALSCWNNVGSKNSWIYVRNPEQGQIYKSGSKYYIYLSGAWYQYTGKNVSNGDIVDPSCRKDPHTHGTDCDCDKTPHTHSTRCYRDSLHTHNSDCYAYSCGKETHTHTNDCLRVICPIPAGHTHNDNCKRTNSTNTVKIVYAKYGQTLNTPQSRLWPITDGNGKTYDQGQRWEPSSSDYYDVVLVYIAQMPPEDFTLTLNTAKYKLYTMKYYLQALPGEAYGENDVTVNGIHYKLDNTIVANYNYVTKAEDFFDIRGFTQASSNPGFSGGRIETGASELTVNFYYNRSTYQLEFNNNGIVLDDKKKTGVMYNAPLEEFNFTPSYPSNLEPNAYTFAGWYTSPGCFDGTQVDWETLAMPDGDLMLYAKWVPITHTVRVYKDQKLTEEIGTAQKVNHRSFAVAPSGQVTNGNYIFQGWFYKDEVNGVTVEKAFTFQGIPIVKNMNIYAKWSSHVSVDYTIRYKTVINGQEIEIADPTTGTTIAGQNKTFDAKAGSQLYAQYQIGYYPVTNSHTITMSVDGNHEFTFYYVFVESMPYLVRYVDSTTGMPLADAKRVEDNSLSVVTETFKKINGKMPDAYQKRLVLSARGTDANNDGILDENIITFYYTSDSVHAYYRVVHYIQNIHGDSYREYRSEETVGTIGETYSVSALNLTGFAFKPGKTVINGTPSSAQGTEVTTTLSADGALIELYYDRISYQYTVHYLDSKTQEDLVTPKTGTALFGAQVLEYAKNLEDLGYTLVGDATSKLLNISANKEYNRIEFLYQEKTVALKYQIVGPLGCGALSQDSENLTAITGTPNGSAPIVNNGFLFLGWYKDSACTIPVDPAWVDAQTNRILPQKTGNVWNATTYYAKFAALETDLTITTASTAATDANQTFLFRIQGKPGTETGHIDLTVSIVGNNSVTITKLPTGDYTVTELTDWSWRYENSTAAREITLNYNSSNNRILYDNSRENGSWLDGNAVRDNEFFKH